VDKGARTYVRGTVIAAVIALNAIVGLSLLVGARVHRLVAFMASGTGSAVATVITLAGGHSDAAQGSPPQSREEVLTFAAGFRRVGVPGPVRQRSS